MKRSILPLLLLALPFAACQPKEEAPAEPAAAAAPAAPDPNSPEGKIASAMAAGPSSITSAATIVDVGADGTMTQLRAGTNGWTCIPNVPASPKVDPMCMDGPWMTWMDAWMKKATPKITSEGIAYMLEGGQDPSNDDPFATEPAPGASWVETGPHVMVLPTNPKSLDAMPNDPKAAGPFVMFRGTPYAHVMVPVR